MRFPRQRDGRLVREAGQHDVLQAMVRDDNITQQQADQAFAEDLRDRGKLDLTEAFIEAGTRPFEKDFVGAIRWRGQARFG